MIIKIMLMIIIIKPTWGAPGVTRGCPRSAPGVKQGQSILGV